MLVWTREIQLFQKPVENFKLKLFYLLHGVSISTRTSNGASSDQIYKKTYYLDI